MPAYLLESSVAALCSAAAFGMAWFAYRRGRSDWALAGILLGGLALRLYAGADQYLHVWDEKFHALVAKNLLAHPLRPTLIDKPVLPYDVRAWYANHIWLHKPPLPLWLMAASIGAFGANEWTVRLPSLLLSLLAIYLTFRMGRYLFDTRVGLLAAFLHAVHGKLIEVAAGRDSSDHVETCHVVMFQLAMWWVLRDWQRRDGRWAAPLIGVFTGLAFLSKWTPAAFVPAIWLLGAIIQRFTLRQILVRSLNMATTCLAVVLPWVYYIAVHYPAESRALCEGVLRANSAIVEAHGGPWYFYIDRARILFGELIYLPMVAAVWAFYRRPRRMGILALILWIGVPLLSLSAAATKRDTYLLVTAPAFFLLTAYAVRVLWLARHRRHSRRRLYAGLAALFLLLPLRYGIERTKLFMFRERRPAWMEQLDHLKEQLPASPGKTLLFGYEHNIEMMFYTGITAYAVTPADAELDKLSDAGYNVYVVKVDALQKWK